MLTIGTIGRKVACVRKNSFFGGVLPTAMVNDADGAGAFHAVQIAAQGAEFFFVRIKLLLLLRRDAGVTDVGGVRLGFR